MSKIIITYSSKEFTSLRIVIPFTRVDGFIVTRFTDESLVDIINNLNDAGNRVTSIEIKEYT